MHISEPTPTEPTLVLQKKVCMIGSFAVGKTSLVSRYVHNRFSDKYLSTIGVKIDRKVLRLGDTEIQMMLWDLNGEDAFQRVRLSYLRGAHGYLLVADGTRRNTLETALKLSRQIVEAFGDLPRVIALNKSDLKAEWEIKDKDINPLRDAGWTLFETSAKETQSVDETFRHLAGRMITDPPA